MRPLVVTLAIDAAAQARFDDERQRLFPPGRTEVGAHVTLFHAVPADLDVEADLRTVGGPRFDVAVTQVMSLGRGVAYRLESDELTRRHEQLQRRWRSRLTAQDRQGFRPHVTVQNKVDAATAKATYADLSAAFTPFSVRAESFVLWRYDGGPWTHLADVPFD